MSSNFPARIVEGFEDTSVHEYTPASDAHVIPGSFWFYDTTGNDANLCGADPTVIGGLSEVDSDEAEELTPNRKVPYRQINGPKATIALSSSTTPADSHIGDQYGITKDATTGNWQLDTGKTGASARVLVKRVDITNGIFYCQLLNDQAQF